MNETTSLAIKSTQEYSTSADFTFFEEVNTLDSSSVEVVNAQLGSLVPTSTKSTESVFQGEVHATANDMISIHLPANAIEEGNFASNTFEISFTGQLPGVGIEALNLQTITLFPNPGNGVFYLRTEGLDSRLPYKIQCTSMSGKVFYADTFYGRDELMLDLSDLSEGMYLLQLSKDKEVLGVAKLIISSN